MGTYATAASATDGFAAKRVPSRLTCRANNRAFGCFGHFHYALRFAPSSTMHHFVQARYHGVCRSAPGFLHFQSGSSLRSSTRSFIPQARCSLRVPQLLMARTGIHDDCAHLVLHSVPCVAQCFRFAQGVGAVSLGHTLRRCRRPALPCSRSTAHRHRQSKIAARSCRDFVAQENSGSVEHGRNRYCVSDFAHARQQHHRTLIFYTLPCIFRYEKRCFSRVLFRAVGAPYRESGTAVP